MHNKIANESSIEQKKIAKTVKKKAETSLLVIVCPAGGGDISWTSVPVSECPSVPMSQWTESERFALRRLMEITRGVPRGPR